MSRCNIYLDESGDLGFKFDAPYRAGGSSRYLTLAALICPDDSKKQIKRFMAKFYAARGVGAEAERKWADLLAPDRLEFARHAARLAVQHPHIRYASITVYKPRVMRHIRTDPNKLYNYMAGLLLLPVMRRFDRVCFVPDARSIKVKSGNSLHDYLQTRLWFDEGAATTLQTLPSDSAKARPLHFADFLCGVFQSSFEDAAVEPRTFLEPVTACHRLFFPDAAPNDARRLLWRCRRGTKELDVLLERYVKRCYPQADDTERKTFERLLDLPDPELSDYLLGHATPTESGLAALIRRIATHYA